METSVGNGPVPASSIQGRSRGSSAPNSPGGQATYTIAHGLAGTPSFVCVQPKNTLSAALFFLTADATNITITYAVAPLSGTLGFYWSAEL
ncbi:MAG TPA: hypothetical protein VIN03_16650 [Roseateles sp.]